MVDPELTGGLRISSGLGMLFVAEKVENVAENRDVQSSLVAFCHWDPRKWID